MLNVNDDMRVMKEERTDRSRGVAEWLQEGQHLTAVGAYDATKCELDVTALKRARVFVDSLDSTAANGDIGRAIAAGQYALTEVSGEIGEVLAGIKTGRISAS